MALDATKFAPKAPKAKKVAGTMQGRFVPQNPAKYVGNPNRIMFRSSWELKFFKYLDRMNAVMRWGSEELAIPYVSPKDNRVHKYYPDVIVWYKDTAGNIQKEIVEIKPYKESVITPKMSDRDKEAYVINQAKWSYAAKFAEANGAKFRVITERTMFKQAPQKAKGTAV